MRILIVSDIHANYAALAAIDEPHDLCLCLGDLVDYGPDPAECVRWAMERVTYAIRGNRNEAREPTFWWWLSRPLAFIGPLLFTLPVIYLFGRRWMRKPKVGASTGTVPAA